MLSWRSSSSTKMGGIESAYSAKCLGDLMATFLLRMCLKIVCFTKTPIPSTAPLL